MNVSNAIVSRVWSSKILSRTKIRLKYSRKLVCKFDSFQSEQNCSTDSLYSNRKIVIIVSWVLLIFFAYKVANIQPDYVSFDPFEILGIDPGSSTAEIRKAYRRLSLIYHPDKETGDERVFMKITKAHAALTDETARKNWEEYGNPDGPGAMSFGIALPSWIVEKNNSKFVLIVYILLLMFALPIAVRIWWSNSSKYGDIKVLLGTSQMYYYFFYHYPSMILPRVIMILTASFEFQRGHNSEIVERETDNVEIPSLIKKIPNFQLTTRDQNLAQPHAVKTRALLYAHLMRIPLNGNTLELDKKYMLTKCPYLIQEFVQCGAQMTMLALAQRIKKRPTLESIEHAMKLSPMIVQGLWTNKSSLLQLPHITEDMLKFFLNRKRNIRNVHSLAVLEESDRRSLLKSLSDEQYDDLVLVLGNMPYLIIDARTEVVDDEDANVITAGALVTVTVTLTRQTMSTLFVNNGGEGGGGSVAGDHPGGDEDNLLKEAEAKASSKSWQKVKKGGKKKAKGMSEFGFGDE